MPFWPTGVRIVANERLRQHESRKCLMPLELLKRDFCRLKTVISIIVPQSQEEDLFRPTNMNYWFPIGDVLLERVACGKMLAPFLP